MLELQNVSYQVNDDSDDKEILKDINLKINEHLVVITGPNGGGKSTLANVIAGIIKPVSGKIILDGEDKLYLMAQILQGFLLLKGQKRV